MLAWAQDRRSDQSVDTAILQQYRGNTIDRELGRVILVDPCVLGALLGRGANCFPSTEIMGKELRRDTPRYKVRNDIYSTIRATIFSFIPFHRLSYCY
jgi:hypothetical protein